MIVESELSQNKFSLHKDTRKAFSMAALSNTRTIETFRCHKKYVKDIATFVMLITDYAVKVYYVGVELDENQNTAFFPSFEVK